MTKESHTGLDWSYFWIILQIYIFYYMEMSDSYKRKSYRYGLIILLNRIKVWNLTIWKRVTLLMKESHGPIILFEYNTCVKFFLYGKEVSMIFYRKKVRQAWNDYSVTFFIIWKIVIFLEKQIWIDIWGEWWYIPLCKTNQFSQYSEWQNESADPNLSSL